MCPSAKQKQCTNKLYTNLINSFFTKLSNMFIPFIYSFYSNLKSWHAYRSEYHQIIHKRENSILQHPFDSFIIQSMSSSISVYECGVCKLQYDSRVRAPVIVCLQQHLFCENCNDRHLTKPGAECPECRKEIEREKVAKFRLFPKFELRLEQTNQNNRQKMVVAKKNLLPIFGEIIDILGRGDKKAKLPSFLKNMAQSQMKSGLYAEAIELLKKVIDSNPSEAKAEECMGVGCDEASLGFCELEDFKWYADRSEDNKLSLFDQLALCFQKEGNREAAADYYAKFRRSETEHAQCYQIVFGAAVNEHNAGRIETALQLYATVISLNPAFGQPYALMALIHLSGGETELALESATKCLKRQKTNICAQFVYAFSQEPENFENIEKQLTKLVETQPKYVRAINAIGEIYLKEGCFDKARIEFQKCLALNKAFVQPQVNLGKAFYGLKDYEHAIEAFVSAAVRQKSTEAECFFELGVTYLATKEFKAALRYFHCCLDINPSNVAAYLHMAEAHWGLGDFRSAANTARRFLDAPTAPFPEQRWSMYKCAAEAFTELKEVEKAKEWLRKWEEEFPEDNCELRLCAGQLLMSLGQFKEALPHYEYCLDNFHQLQVTYPDTIKVYSNLGEEAKERQLAEEYRQNCEPTAQKSEKEKKDRKRIRNHSTHK